jgi:hypothetical protein
MAPAAAVPRAAGKDSCRCPGTPPLLCGREEGRRKGIFAQNPLLSLLFVKEPFHPFFPFAKDLPEGFKDGKFNPAL